MRARALLAVTAAVALAATGSAHAATKKKPIPKACNLVKDKAGDVSNDFEGVGAFPADPGLDVLGGDVASDGRNITAVMRLAAEPGDATIYAKRYITQFKVAGQANPMILALAITPTGATYSFGYYGTSTTGTGWNYPGTATGSADGKTIRVTASLADVAAIEQLGPIKKGAKISAITVNSYRRVPAVAQAPGQLVEADLSSGRTPYYAGNPSCIKP